MLSPFHSLRSRSTGLMTSLTLWISCSEATPNRRTTTLVTSLVTMTWLLVTNRFLKTTRDSKLSIRHEMLNGTTAETAEVVTTASWTALFSLTRVS